MFVIIFHRDRAELMEDVPDSDTGVGVQHLPYRAGQATGAKPAVVLRALCEMSIYAEKWRREEQQSFYSNVSHLYRR